MRQEKKREERGEEKTPTSTPMIDQCASINAPQTPIFFSLGPDSLIHYSSASFHIPLLLLPSSSSSSRPLVDPHTRRHRSLLSSLPAFLSTTSLPCFSASFVSNGLIAAFDSGFLSRQVMARPRSCRSATRLEATNRTEALKWVYPTKRSHCPCVEATEDSELLRSRWVCSH